MSAVEFVHAPLESDPWEVLVRTRVLKRATVDLLRVAFELGGYVAGGFARFVCRYHPHWDASDRRGRDGWYLAYDYLGGAKKIDRSLRWWKANRGDIDVFFPSSDAAAAFMERAPSVSPLVVMQGPSPSGACQEIDCAGVNSVQIVTKYVGPIEDQLRSFDIYNAMVAVNDRETIVPAQWRELEDLKMLHVVNWTSLFVVNRLHKYSYKHGLCNLSPKTASEIGEQAFSLIERLKKDPIANPWGGFFTHRQVIDRLKVWLPQLSNDELLLLTSVYTDGYDTAFRHLHSRMRAAKSSLTAST